MPRQQVDMLGLPSHGWLTQDEANLLYEYASKCQGPILEVGSYQGRSTVLLARLGREIYAVDPFIGFAKHDPTGELTEAAFLEATKDLPNVKLFKCKIEQWVPRPCGFCYLDGDHTYEGTLAQTGIAKQCRPKYIAAHDVNDRGAGRFVRQACLEQLGLWIERAGRLAVFKNG